MDAGIVVAIGSITTVIACSSIRAQTTQAAPEKGGYTLLAPTPRDQMRAMNADRPSVTESPITVDAGHFQAEFSYFEFTRNDHAGTRVDDASVLPMNLKVGLLNNADLQLLFTPYENERVKGRGEQSRDEGFGDAELRLKLNFWGNDGPDPTFGDTAFGIMPFVKFPTGTGDLSNDHVEGGLIFPFVANLPAGFQLSAMIELDARYDDGSNGYGLAIVHSIVLGHDLPSLKDLNGYIEYVGIAPHDTGDTYQAIGSAGVTYSVNDDLIVDFGGRAGLSRSAEDFTLFVGTSFRI